MAIQSGYIRYNELHTSLQYNIPYIVIQDFLFNDDDWNITSEGLYSININLSSSYNINDNINLRLRYIDMKMENRSTSETHFAIENIIFSYNYTINTDGDIILTVTVDELDDYIFMVLLYVDSTDSVPV